MRAIKGVLSILGVSLVVLSIALLTVDLGWLRPYALAFVNDSLEEHTLAIQGELSLRIGPTITLAAQDITLRHTDDATDSALLSVDQLAASIPLHRLLKQPVLIDTVTIAGATINLVRGEDGRGNWVFTQTENEAEDQIPAMADEEPAALPVLLDALRITNVALRYEDPARDIAQVLALTDLTQRLQANVLYTDLRGTLNSEELTLSLQINDVGELVALDQPDITLRGRLGSLTLSGDFVPDTLRALARPEFALLLQTPDSNRLLTSMGIDSAISGPFSLRVEGSRYVDGTAANEQLLLKSDLQLGDYRATAASTLASIQNVEQIRLEFGTSGGDIADLLNTLGIDHALPALAFELAGTLHREGEQLTLSDAAGRFGTLRVTGKGSIPNINRPHHNSLMLTMTTDDLGEHTSWLGLPTHWQGPTHIDVNLEQQDDTTQFTVALESALGQLMSSGVLEGDSETRVTSRIELDLPSIKALLPPEQHQTLDHDSRIALTGELFWQDNRAQAQNVVLRLDTNNMTEGADESSPMGKAQRLLLSATVDGTVALDDRQAPSLVDLSARVQSPNMAWVSQHAPVSGAPLPAIALDSRLGLSFDGTRWQLQMPEVNLDDATFTGAVAWGKARDMLTAAQLLMSSDTLGNNSAQTVAAARSGDYLPAIVFAIEGDIPDWEALVPADTAFGYRMASVNTTPKAEQAASPADTAIGPIDGTVSLNGTWFEDHIWLENSALRLGENHIDMHGHLQTDGDFNDISLRIGLRLNDLSDFGDVADLVLPETGLQGTLQLQGNRERLMLPASEFSLNGTTFTAQADLFAQSDMRPIPELRLSLTADTLDIAPFFTVDATNPEPAPEPAPKRSSARLLSTEALDLAGLQAVNANLAVRIDALKTDARTWQDIDVSLSLRDGLLLLDTLELSDETGGLLTANGHLHVHAIEPTIDSTVAFSAPSVNEIDSTLAAVTPSSPAAHSLSFNLTTRDINLGIPATNAKQLAALPRFTSSVQLKTTGLSPADFGRQLNGYARIASNPGRFPNAGLDFLTNDFISQLFSALNPFKEKSTGMNVECIAVMAAVRDGQITEKPTFVLRTPRLNITADTDINLGTEKLNASFKTVPQQGLGISMTSLVNPFVGIGGTLAKPRLSLDAASTLLEGGAAVATGGLSMLAMSLKDRLLSSSDPCGTALTAFDTTHNLTPMVIPVDAPPGE